jgi:predicted porin
VNDKGQSATLATRNTFVGLQGDRWGTIELGNIDTAYKQLTDIGLSVLPNMVTDQNTGGAVVYNRRVTRLTNSVHYFSPMLNGFKFGVSYGVDEARPTATDGTRQDDDRLSIAGNYSNGGLQVALGYDREGDKLNSALSSDGQKSVTAGKLAVSYTFATGTLIGAGIEHVKTANNGSADTTQNDWLIALSQPISGPLTLKAGYAQLGQLSGASVGSPDDYKARQWFLGATYDLSKRSQLYAYGTRVNNHAQQNANFPTNPVYTSGLGTPGAALAKGSNLQAIGAGLMVAF